MCQKSRRRGEIHRESGKESEGRFGIAIGRMKAVGGAEEKETPWTRFTEFRDSLRLATPCLLRVR